MDILRSLSQTQITLLGQLLTLFLKAVMVDLLVYIANRIAGDRSLGMILLTCKKQSREAKIEKEPLPAKNVLKISQLN